jgi:PilZ domain
MPQEPDKSHMRRAERAPLKAAVSFRAAGGRVAYGWSRDVSLKGLYVHTDERERIGTLCRLRLTIRGPEGIVRVELEGQVARYDGDGIAFQFDALPDDVHAVIAGVVEAHLHAALGPAQPDPAPAPATPAGSGARS